MFSDKFINAEVILLEYHSCQYVGDQVVDRLFDGRFCGVAIFQVSGLSIRPSQRTSAFMFPLLYSL